MGSEREENHHQYPWGGRGGRTENSSRDQSEYGEIPGLNYVNIKRTGVIPEAQYGDHLKNCVVA